MGVVIAIVTAATFNLVCVGTRYSSDKFDPDASKKPVELIARVDLDQKRWCAGDCNATAPIHRVSDTEIVFDYVDTQILLKSFVVNRESGAFEQKTHTRGTKWVQIITGQCERANFSGFPKRKF
ncbi:hypothetical protein [Sphingomonas sp. 35-24ZXX]|uniref:hypothetical protein n=1 Tax=Sphingomonas sp. 35-24ZXX TaxID=1545915 RepID=UPI00053BE03E|nr:hypothetical protein [Sphingomonas sp. 35-24ZXX]